MEARIGKNKQNIGKFSSFLDRGKFILEREKTMVKTEKYRNLGGFIRNVRCGGIR